VQSSQLRPRRRCSARWVSALLLFSKWRDSCFAGGARPIGARCSADLAARVGGERQARALIGRGIGCTAKNRATRILAWTRRSTPHFFSPSHRSPELSSQTQAQLRGAKIKFFEEKKYARFYRPHETSWLRKNFAENLRDILTQKNWKRTEKYEKIEPKKGTRLF
jgi:hypothetical protein